MIYVRRTITQNEHAIEIIGADTKTQAGKRSIPMTVEAMNAITTQMKTNKQIFGADTNSYPIFRAMGGGLLNRNTFNDALIRLCKKADINDKITSHAFRATFATRAIESGMNPKTLQEILGHGNISMTMNLYAHVMESTKTREMSQLKI